jgi:DNA polymerase delta subunit 1
MVSFQVVAWHGEDTDDAYVIHIFGRTEDGKSVHVETPFEPYFFVKVPPDRSPKALIQEIQPYSSAVIKRKDLWGFRNQEEYTFLKLGFRTLAELKECRPRGLKVYEKNLDPVLRFMHRSEIKSTGWVQVPESASPGHDSSCDIDVCVSDWRTLKPVDRDDIAPLRIASLDIESYSESGAFPNAFKEKDTCFQVAVTTKAFGHKEYLDRKCFCVKQTSGPECESFDTEREMLERLGRYLRELDPDIVTGWNIFGFDLEYLYTRAVVTGAGPDAHMWGRLRGIPNELVVKHLASNALGSNDLKMVPMLGRYVFDMFQDIKREHKLESYSLNNVSKEFLKDQKIDMPIKEMFTRFKDGDPDLLGEVADYCIKDTELPHRISEKLCLIQNLIEMAKATWVPLSYLSERGQQIKVFSQLARKARELGFMIPTMYSKATGDDKYQGATVLDAQTGAYYGPITALDFASLYPSIMRAHNLCYSSLVIDPRFANVPGVVYEQYGPYKFAQGVPSLLPAILNELAAFRKKAKKLMAAAEGTPMEAVYNGQQLAYKISMNSIYGFTGASKGMLPCVAIASTVTMRGRQMIEETKNYVEEHFPGAKVRYGDSVMPGTPVVIRTNGVVSVLTIESLGGIWTEYPGFLKQGTDKEETSLSDIETWTHDGWKPVKRIIRHKCIKKIYRVLTHTGLVDVTEDHSLLGPNLSLLKPGEVEVGQKLFHSFPELPVWDEPSSYEQAFIYGMFVGDGSCGDYVCPSGRKATWGINNADKTLLEKCKEYCEKIHPTYTFVIMDTLKSSGVYKLSPRGGSVIDLVRKYREACYDDQAKKVPIEAFSNPRAFLDGLWASDGCRKDNDMSGCHRIDTKNQVTAQWYYLLLRSMGYNVSLNTRSDKPNVFRLTWTLSNFRKDPNVIKKIVILHDSWDGYVYDLETEAGTFQAGVGQMIVKNTDSVMVEFDVQGRKGQAAIDYSWEQGELASEQCSKLFKAPNDLELEKVYCPYFLYSKKRYAAKMYEKKAGRDGEPSRVVFKKIDVKGLQVVRRDTCMYVRGVLKQLLNLVLNSEDPRPAIEYARESAKKLLKGKVDPKELTMSKQLGSDYKTRVPHVEVRDKIKKRAPGSEPQNGDRVAFLITKVPGLLCDKAEDPSWVTENKIPLDYVYYFEHQLVKPVCDLLEPLVGANPFQTIFKSVDYLTTPSISTYFRPQVRRT